MTAWSRGLWREAVSGTVRTPRAPTRRGVCAEHAQTFFYRAFWSGQRCRGTHLLAYSPTCVKPQISRSAPFQGGVPRAAKPAFSAPAGAGAVEGDGRARPRPSSHITTTFKSIFCRADNAGRPRFAAEPAGGGCSAAVARPLPHAREGPRFPRPSSPASAGWPVPVFYRLQLRAGPGLRTPSGRGASVPASAWPRPPRRSRGASDALGGASGGCVMHAAVVRRRGRRRGGNWRSPRGHGPHRLRQRLPQPALRCGFRGPFVSRPCGLSPREITPRTPPTLTKHEY